MGKQTQQFDLSGFTKQSDGSYKKNSTSIQSRNVKLKNLSDDLFKSTAINPCKPSKVNDSFIGSKVPVDLFGEEKLYEPKPLSKITLTLFGEPMPKQSVRGYATGRRNEKGTLIVDHFQPKKTVDRKKDYIKQIKEQLPEDFKPFMEKVFVTKFHCVYAPLKSFHKIKGRMEAIRNGEIFYKATQPDLIDNLKKLIFDCLGKDKTTKIPLVLGNDGIIVGEDNTRKYYGTGGMIILELAGY